MGGAAGRRGSLAAALLGVALACACSPSGSPAAPGTPAPVHTGWPGCEALGAFVDPGFSGDAPPPTGGVPPGFVARTVVLCDDGRERTSTEVASLLTYLAQPDDTTPVDACTADGWLPPWLFLLDADGRYVAPRIPVDQCGKPLGWYEREHGLPWTLLPYTDRVVARTAPTEDPEAAATGCGSAYKSPVPELGRDPEGRGRPLGETGFGDRPLRVCVWGIDGDQGRDDVVVGTFVAGRTLEGAEQAALVRALEAAPAGPARNRCRESAGTFATIEPASGGDAEMVWAELDGCRRLVHDGHPARVALTTPDLVDLLKG